MKTTVIREHQIRRWLPSMPHQSEGKLPGRLFEVHAVKGQPGLYECPPPGEHDPHAGGLRNLARTADIRDHSELVHDVVFDGDPAMPSPLFVMNEKDTWRIAIPHVTSFFINTNNEFTVVVNGTQSVIQCGTPERTRETYDAFVAAYTAWWQAQKR